MSSATATFAPSSWREGIFRPLASFWSPDSKSTGHAPTPAVNEAKEEYDEDSESSLDDPQAAAELLYDAQEDLINHDYADAVKKLEKSARHGNSAACAYLANVLTHGLDCGDEEHEEERVNVDPSAAARYALRGLELELGNALDPPTSRRAPTMESGPSTSDFDLATPSNTPSESGPFDLQSSADCASTLALLFRTRKVHIKVGQNAEEKGKHVNLADSAQRIGTLMLEHDAVQTPHPTSSQEKLRKIININLLYLIALMDAERGEEEVADAGWRRVVAVGEAGPIGDNTADELVGNARRRLILLQTQRRQSEEHSPTLSTSERKRPSFERRSSVPHRRPTTPIRKAQFELGDDSLASPDTQERDNPFSRTTRLAPPSPRSVRSPNRAQGRPVSPPQASQPSSRLLHTLSCAFEADMPRPAPPTVAIEVGSVILPPQEKLRSRTSVVSMVHDTLPSSRSLQNVSLRRDTSAASLPDLVRPLSSPVSPILSATSRFSHFRRWVDELSSDETPPTDAADALRQALQRHDAIIADANLTDVEEEEEESPAPFRKAVSEQGPLSPPTKAAPQLRIRGVDPMLAKLEDASRVNVLSVCAVCDAKGVNFPRCPKCRQTYCSRACRIGPGGGDGERHVCSTSTTPSTQTPTPAPELADSHHRGG